MRLGQGKSGDLGLCLGVRRLGCGGGEEGEDQAANGKQVEGLPESQPGDRRLGWPSQWENPSTHR